MITALVHVAVGAVVALVFLGVIASIHVYRRGIPMWFGVPIDALIAFVFLCIGATYPPARYVAFAIGGTYAYSFLTARIDHWQQRSRSSILAALLDLIGEHGSMQWARVEDLRRRACVDDCTQRVLTYEGAIIERSDSKLGSVAFWTHLRLLVRQGELELLEASPPNPREDRVRLGPRYRCTVKCDGP